MQPFGYRRATNVETAVAAGQAKGARFLGGGTNLVDLMREAVERPTTLVDVTGLSREIRAAPGGGLMIGAAASNTAVAEHPVVRRAYPALSRALLAGASAQIRNMATVGGNILQRTRCAYFYDVEGSRCNKRKPGAGCDARDGHHRNHAILGHSAQCVATHPSDMCVALTAFDAVVHLVGRNGERAVPMSDFHRLPGTTPHIETAIASGELITAIELPSLTLAARSEYRKVRDRSSYAFALVSVAAAIAAEDGIVTGVRLALGGVAHRPWRASNAEKAMIGRPATVDTFRAAAREELSAAAPLEGNVFKVALAERAIVATLRDLVGERA